MTMNMEIDITRDQSISTSINNFRALLVYYNISSVVYTKYIQTLANNSIWAN